MALSEQELDIARQIKEQGGTEQDFYDVLDQVRGKQEQVSQVEPTQEMEVPQVKTTGIIPTQKAPIEDKSFLQKAGESLKEQVSTGLISKGIGRAESAVESAKRGEILPTIGKTFETGLQITGGASEEALSQGINAATSLFKNSLAYKMLPSGVKESVKSIATGTVDLANKPAVANLFSTIGKQIDKIPENYRADFQATLNLIPGKMATSEITLTKGAAEKISKDALAKADKLARELLKPGKYDEYASKVFVDNIKTAKSYGEVTENLSASLKETGVKLNAALSKVGQVPKDDRIKGAIDFLISDLKSNPVLAALPERAAKIKELESLSKGMGWGGKNIKLVDVQKIKNEIDDTFDLYKTSGDVKAGDAAKALEPERKYVKQFIEKYAPEAKELNTTYSGLREAKSLAKEKARQFGNDASPDPTFFGQIRELPIIKGFIGKSDLPSRLKIEASQIGKKTAEIGKYVRLAKKVKPVSEIFKVPELGKKLNPLANILKKK